MILAILLGSFFQIESEYLDPTFESLPPVYDFGETNVTVPFNANTVAVGIHIAPQNKFKQGSQEYTNTLARVQFYDPIAGQIEGVYCEELFKN